MTDVHAQSNDDSLARLAAEISTALDRASGLPYLSHNEDAAKRGVGKESMSNDRDEEEDDESSSPIMAFAPTAIDSTTDRQTPMSASHRARHSPSTQSNNTESSSPVAQFATPASSSQSPAQAIIELEKSTNDTLHKRNQKSSTSSTSSRPSLIARARSGSASNVLARLTSRNSLVDTHRSADSAVSKGSYAPEGDAAHVARPKLDRAALTQRREKFKSGVNWENADLMINQTAEPYEATSSPVEERKVDHLLEQARQESIRELASAGGTKAALAQANATAIGTPYFPAAERATHDVSTTREIASKPAKRRSVMELQAATAQPVATLDTATSDSPPKQDKITTESAQQILESARNAVAMSNAAAARQTSQPSSQQRKNDEKAMADKASLKPSLEVPGQKTKRLSFLSFGSSKNVKEVSEKVSSKAKSAKKATNKKSKGKDSNVMSNHDVVKSSTTLSVASADSNPASVSSDGTTTPGGGSTRQRRFRDTRELGLVASQLAAEALAPPSAYGPMHGQQASMMSLVAADNDADLPLPQPGFAAGSASSSQSGSPLSGSPRQMPVDMPRFESPRAAFARPSLSNSPSSSPYMTQSAKIQGLPKDMLTGLSDGPYPTLPPRYADFSDPFGMPSAPSEFEVSGSMGRRTRGMSSGSTNTLGSGHSGGRRNVLTMSMHNPQQEMQGLTKKPRSSRSTPFGSRAPSRQATPKNSSTNLRELANEEAEKAARAAAAAAAANTAFVAQSPNNNTSPSGETNARNATGKELGKSSSSSPGGSRLSLFKKTKSPIDGETKSKGKPASGGKESQRLMPPSPSNGSATGGSNRFSSQSRLSVTNDSTTSHDRSATSATSASNDHRESPASRPNGSVHSLVKMPSPSMTSASSSHGRSTRGSSSEGELSTQNATSTVTTPEVAPRKIDLSPPTTAVARPPTVSPTKASAMQPVAAVAAAIPRADKVVPLDAMAKSHESTLPSRMAPRQTKPDMSSSRSTDQLAARTIGVKANGKQGQGAAAPASNKRLPSSPSSAQAQAQSQSQSLGRMSKFASRFASRSSSNLREFGSPSSTTVNSTDGKSSSVASTKTASAKPSSNGFSLAKSQGQPTSPPSQQQQQQQQQQKNVDKGKASGPAPSTHSSSIGKLGDFRKSLKRDWFV